MTEKTQDQTKIVSDAVLAEWYAVGWSYVGPDDSSPDHSVISWQLGEPVVAPFSEAMRVAEAVGMLEGRAEG
ncbi:hypothetical protein [Tardiphaga sp.]|uniref:hypothetical protein n=1 Tax=Tardiphaga sp. TaxID=1926292 RepID=UPI002632D6FF|nr:hypothetical protein [Tardiphaga sp.]MDB5617070.1 hypothetical protein [Tardiphaga sp.]